MNKMILMLTTRGELTDAEAEAMFGTRIKPLNTLADRVRYVLRHAAYEDRREIVLAALEELHQRSDGKKP